MFTPNTAKGCRQLFRVSRDAHPAPGTVGISSPPFWDREEPFSIPIRRAHDAHGDARGDGVVGRVRRLPGSYGAPGREGDKR
jgi:hypothetical protein